MILLKTKGADKKMQHYHRLIVLHCDLAREITAA